MSGRRGKGTLTAIVTALAIVASVATASGQPVRTHPSSGHPIAAQASFAQQCSDSQYAAARDPANPLALPTPPPASDPLRGAHFFVDGPAHGAAAGAIAQLLGVDPASYPDSYSWAQFEQDLSPGGSLYPKLAADPALAGEVAELAKIAGQPETQNVSLYAQGGGPGAIFTQTKKILCQNLAADHDPMPVPVFSTFLIYPKGQFCPRLAALNANRATFRRQVDEMAAATGRRPAVFLLEIDAVGTSMCLKGKARKLWDSLLRYEIQKMTGLPHTVVYVEGGAADEGTPGYVSGMLADICVFHGRNVCARMRGFYVNDTHFDWTTNEVNYANAVSAALAKLMRKRTGHIYTARFIVNTAQNGDGPLLNPHPVTQGIEDLCNPTGRGIGRLPTAYTDPTYDGLFFGATDAFLWTGVPGRSHNSSCHPGDAPAGVFDPRFALELATNQSNQLGSGRPVLGQPVLGRTFDAMLVSGIVFVRVPGGAADISQAAPASAGTGPGFVQLTAPRVLPMGTQIDARRGSLELIAATATNRGTQSGVFGSGVFKVTQARRGRLKGLTTLALREGAFRGGPTYASCRVGAAADRGPAAVAARRLSSAVIQTLRASERGAHFRTRGRYSAGTARGTVWNTVDRCDGTLIAVRRGTVVVTDFVRHVTVKVTAGHSYLAKASHG